MALKLNVGTVLPPPSSQPAPPVVHKTITATTPVKSVKAPEKTAEQKKADKNKPAPATNLSAIVEAFRKTKPNVMVIANTIKPVARLATGVFEFDFHTGGGFPRGRYTIVFGPESSGKTNICYLAAAQAQRGPESCNKVVWVNVETTFDPLWAAQFGVDISKLLVINPGYGEEAVDAIDAVVRAVDVAAVFVDSIAALISSKEISQSAENYDVGTSALMIKRLVNKLMVAFGAQSRFNHYPAVVLINQTRYKIGVMFGNPETIPGGMAQKFLASLIIRLSGKNKIVKEFNADLPVFKETTAQITKSKVPIVAVKFEFDLCMVPHGHLKVGDTDSFSTVLTYLKTLGYLAKEKNGYEIVGEMTTIATPGVGVGFKQVQKSWATQTSIETQYYMDTDFKLRLQKLVIDAYADKTMLVDDPSLATIPAYNQSQQTGQVPLEGGTDGEDQVID